MNDSAGKIQTLTTDFTVFLDYLVSISLHSLFLDLSPVPHVLEHGVHSTRMVEMSIEIANWVKWLPSLPDHSVGSGHLFSLHSILSVSDPGQRVARTRLALRPPLPGISHLRRRTFSPPPQVWLQSPHGPHSVQAVGKRGFENPNTNYIEYFSGTAKTVAS